MSAVEKHGPKAELPGRVRPLGVATSDLSRGRLIRLFTNDAAPVTLVCAPAGSGKTSLLASWVATAPGAAIAWLSLDRHDDDPALLWARILQAMKDTGRFPDGSRLDQLTAPPGQISPDFIEVLVAEVAALHEPVWLVLDDVHVIQHEAALDSIDSLVRRMTDGFRLVITSRTDPAIGLPPLRLAGRLREARSADLAFTREETAEFVAGQGLELSDASLDLLQTRTEGWVAAIKIATMAMQAGQEPADFIERFGGDDHAVADYLITEVLATLPEEIRDFLLRTSICEEMSPGIAQRLSGRSDAAAVLDGLERDNTFTRRLGRGHGAYRYHELLRTFLMAELRRTDGETERRLQHIAAEWYQDRGDHLHAMEHFALAGHVDRFVEVADAHGIAVILDGRARWLATVLDRIGDRYRCVPVVALLGAAAAMELGRLDDADRWLLGIDLQALITGPDRTITSLAATVAAARARFSPRVDVALAQLESTQAGATGDRDRDLYALIHRGVIRMYLGRYEDAIRDLDRAVDIAQITRRDAVQVACRSFLAGIRASMGEYPAMREQAELAVQLAAQRGWVGSSAVAHAHVMAGWGSYLRADTPSAAGHVTLAIASLGQHNDPDVELAARSLETVVAAGGAAAFETMQRYRKIFGRLADAQMSPALLASTLPLLVRICLDLGERPWAREFAESAIDRSPDPGEPALLRAMLLQDAGNTEAARKELETITRGEVSCHVVTTEISAWLLAAEIESHLGHSVRAQECLLEALGLAEPLEVLRPFLESETVRGLLVSGQGRFGRRESFVAQLLDVPHPSLNPSEAGNRLTPGELAVLRELPSLLSLREIADARCVSVNTVKSHLRAIYHKLGVSGRRQAVEAGRRRGIL